MPSTINTGTEVRGNGTFPIDAVELVRETGCGEFALGLFEEGVGDVDLKGSWGGHVVIVGGKVGQSWVGVRTSFGEGTVSTAAIRKSTPRKLRSSLTTVAVTDCK